jgi:hypothetical protein
MIMTEAVLSKKIGRKLRDKGCFAVKIHGGPNQQRGLPDIVGCYDGDFFGLEVKLPGKERTLTELQAKKLRDIKQAGGIAVVVTTVNEAVAAVGC